MFEIGKEYKIVREYDGNGVKGNFSFINIEDKKPNSNFADKLTICVWGDHFGGNANDTIKIKAVRAFGEKAKKDKNEKWIKELQCNCNLEDLQLIKGNGEINSELPIMTELPQSSEDNLPF